MLVCIVFSKRLKIFMYSMFWRCLRRTIQLSLGFKIAQSFWSMFTICNNLIYHIQNKKMGHIDALPPFLLINHPYSYLKLFQLYVTLCLCLYSKKQCRYAIWTYGAMTARHIWNDEFWNVHRLETSFERNESWNWNHEVTYIFCFYKN